MPYLLLLILGVVVAGAMLALFAGLRSRWETRAADETRFYSVGTLLTLAEVELSRPFFERVLRPTLARLLGLLGRLAPQRNIQELQHKLEIAGRPYGWTVMNFVGLRVLGAMLCTLFFFALLGLSDLSFAARLLLTAVFGILGFYIPVIWLGWRMNQRRRAILRALPDGLDMLNVCVGAGLGFDMALSRVGERWQSPLADEFSRVIAEIRLDKTRRQALLDLATRTDVTEVEIFVAALVQADQLGVSIAKVLHTQAEQMRIARRQRAEELARQASIKMLFPLVFLIFPALLAVLLGPAIPQILRTFTNLGR